MSDSSKSKITSTIFKNTLMFIHFSIIAFTVIFQDNIIPSFVFAVALLCISLFTVAYMCYLAVNNDFYFHLIVIIFCLLRVESFGWDYVTFTDTSPYVLIFIIVGAIIISLFVGLKCKLKKKKDCIVPTVSILLSLIIFSFCTVNILNVALSYNEPYKAEYLLMEQTDEYTASHPFAISTRTYKASPVTADCKYEIEELTFRHSMKIDTSDVVIVEIRNGLFSDVYRVIEAKETEDSLTSSDKTHE